MNISFLKLEDEQYNNIVENFKEFMNINQVQGYYPICSLYFNYYNNDYSNKQFTMKSKYSLKNIINKIDHENKDSYIKFMFNSDIVNNYTKKVENKNIFIKLSPILDVIPYLMNQYNAQHNQYLSNIFQYLTNNKINSYNNSAYIDSFASFCLSNLTESGKCPTFPLFYGTYSGIAENFEFDISDEYEDIKSKKWFQKNLKTKFKVKTKEIICDKLSSSNFSLSSNSSLDLSNNPNISMGEIDDILKKSIMKLVNQDNDNNNSSLDEEVDVIRLDTSDQDEDEAENRSENEAKEAEEDENEAENEAEAEAEEDENEAEEDEEKNKRTDLDNILEAESLESDNSDEWEDVESNDENDNNEEDKELLSDAESLNTDSNISDIEKYTYIQYAALKDFPVQINIIELCDNTLDELIDNEDYELSNTEWKSILFQVCFGMAVAQKQLDFVHNDLHSSNIMLTNTDKEFIYMKYKNNYFKIPTFGKISKIIDFGRATFKINDKIFFSDVFKKYGDAEGQYSYPYHNTFKNCKILPNKSFDLARLSTTIIEHFEEDNDIFNLLRSWATDKYGNCLIYCNDDFDLYKNIAKNVFNSVPKDQLNKKVFSEFRCNKIDIPEDEYVYIY